VVSFAGTVPTSGKTITIDTPGGLAVTLTHLGSLSVADGARVAEGAVVATVGSSGTSDHDVPYVHMGVRTASDPQGYLDPLSFLPAPAPAPVQQASPAAQPPAVQPPSAAPAPPQQAPVQQATAQQAAPAQAAPAAPAPQAQAASGDGHASPSAQPTVVRGPASQRPAARERASAAPRAASGTPVLTGATRASSTARTTPAQPRESGPARAPEGLRAPEPSWRAAAPRLAQPRPARELPAASSALRRPLPGRRHPRLPAIFYAVLAACGACAAAAAAWAARMITAPPPSLERVSSDAIAAEDPGCSGLAVCERPEAPGARSWAWRPVGHLRPLPPAPRQRRPHGQRDGRARDARDGLGRSRRRVAA
jgi:hypothetical protein